MTAAPLYLSRARLRRQVPAAALRELLLPGDDGRRAGAGHRLVWTLFSDSPDRRRDFLWREADDGLFYLLSARAPEDRHGLFDLDPPKPFAPALAPGDRLRFMLRVNATVARGGGDGARGKPCDIVMDALHAAAPSARAEERRRVLAPVAYDWFVRQGARHGFSLDPLPQPGAGDEEDETAAPIRVMGYRTLRVERGRKAPPMRVGVLDIEGTLEVRDPAALVAVIGHGFGRAKAYGCGLMLVRRV